MRLRRLNVFCATWRVTFSSRHCLTVSAAVILTHLGEDGGLLAADVDSGAGSGNQGAKTKGAGAARDRARARMLAHDGEAVFA
jgi:hypothetical protein